MSPLRAWLTLHCNIKVVTFSSHLALDITLDHQLSCEETLAKRLTSMTRRRGGCNESILADRGVGTFGLDQRAGLSQSKSMECN